MMAFFLPLFFVSCATQDQVKSLAARVNRIEYRIYQVDKNTGKKINSNIKSLRQNLADMRADMDSIRHEIGSLRGYSEENRMMLKRIVGSDLSKIDQMKQELEQISQRVSRIEAQIKQVQDYLNLTEETSPRPIKSQKKPSPKTKEDVYSSAFSLYKKGRYEEAILGFKNFLKKYHRSKLSDNAYFWIGECYMGLKRYEKAILAYHEVIKRYPKGNKVPSAMLRQAQAFQKIGDKTSAKLILKRLIKKFPKSNEAKIARKILRKMK